MEFFSSSVSSQDAFSGEMLEIMIGILGKVEIGGKEMVCALQEGGLDMLGLDMQEADRTHTCDQES